jgi:DNA topoisomerase-1
MHELQTQPPRRYGKAGLIAELEKRMLGTKATRAAIIDTLFKRGYIEGAAIKVTGFGMSVYKALDENSNMIVNEETTRKLEEDMDQISEGKKMPDEVIKEGKEMLLEALKIFDSNKEKIAMAMQEGLIETEVPLGKCLKDSGDLVIRRSRAGKQFVACANYPKCVNTYSIPQNAKIVATGKVCEHCHTPIVKVIRKARGVFEMDLDPECVTKQNWKSRREVKAGAGATKLPVATAKELKLAESKPNVAPETMEQPKVERAPKARKRRASRKKGAAGKKPKGRKKERRI